MNPNKKDCWILCPSTRIPGKYYYFNVGTGEAAWNINEIEKRMTSRPNFAHAEKWHSYPEPVSPPEECAWNYQPTFRSFPQPMHGFGQAPFAKYLPTMVDIPQPSMAWPITSPMYVKPPMMTMPMFEPSWPSYGTRAKAPDKNPFQMNPYDLPFNMPKSFTQPQSRQMFAPKSNNFLQTKPPLNLTRTHNNIDMCHAKEPLMKNLRTHEPNETYIPNNLNGNGTKISNIFCEDVTKPKNLAVPAKHTCNCMLSKSQEKVNTWLWKSQENLSAYKQEPYTENALLKTTGLSKSVLNLTDIASSDHSSNFSLKNSFIFPLRKTESKESSTNVCDTLSKLQVTSLKNTKQFETSKSNNQVPSEIISQEDLRHVLVAKRKRSFSKSFAAPSSTGRKIKTSYMDSEFKEVVPKKRVTFDLGLGGSVADEDDRVPHTSELVDPEEDGVREADSKEPCFVIADLDVLLTDFQLLEDYVKGEAAHCLVVPAGCARAVQGAGRGAGGARLAHARRLARMLAAPPSYLIVHSDDNETEDTTTDPALACCCQMVGQGYSVIFITNNAELYNSALALGLECYTTKEVKDYIDIPKPQVSFDLKRIDPDDTSHIKHSHCGQTHIDDLHRNIITTPDCATNNNNDISTDTIIPVNISRKQLFANTDPQEKCSFHADDSKGPTIKRKFSLGSLKCTDNLQKDEDFLYNASLINRDIQKLYLDESFEGNEALAAKKQSHVTIEKPHSNFESFDRMTDEKGLLFKNGDTTHQLCYTAAKTIKNINIYNLNELMKSFTLKSREVEDRVLAKMDEYVCWFTQTMEDALSDILKDTPYAEERGKAPLQSLLTPLREGHADQRTARELAERLTAALDCLYTPSGDDVTLVLDLRPYEFMKILGYGTLLIKCLLNTEGSNARLQAAEHSLSALLAAVHTEGVSGPPSPRAASPHRAAHARKSHRDDYVKSPSEVLQYLQEHYPEWKSVGNRDSAKVTENSKENVLEDKAQEDHGPRVVRTFGKNLGLLKFSRGKKMVLNCQDGGKAENTKDNEIKDKETPEEESGKLTGPKLIKKLALESMNLRPQMKEIDVEKREKINKDLLDMIDKMVSCTDLSKSVTRFYDLDDIVVKHGAGKLSFSSGTNRTVSKSNSSEKIVKDTENVTIDKPSQRPSEQKTSELLDFDILDYSDIEESVCPESDEVGELSNDNSPESHREVTTTNKVADEELSPTGDSRESIDNDDPALWNQGYSMIQVFLINLSKTFNTLLEFIKNSVTALRSGPTDASKKVWYEKAVYAESGVGNIINRLKGIINRESNDETAVARLILSSGSPAERDKRIVQYKQVVTKCVEQAEILATALKIIKKIARDDFDLRSISDRSHKYVTLFE